MNLSEGELYHVFNRGINREVIFPRRVNYGYFLEGVRKNLKGCCDILAWCLMPTHFHFLIHSNERSVPMILDASFARQQFSQGIKQLLSSHAKGINKQEGRTGNLFQQKTKAVLTSLRENDFSRTVFHYIHQNPMRAGLVDSMGDWEFSSYREYLGKSSRGLCNIELACSLLEIDLARFEEDAYRVQQVSYTCQV